VKKKGWQETGEGERVKKGRNNDTTDRQISAGTRFKRKKNMPLNRKGDMLRAKSRGEA